MVLQCCCSEGSCQGWRLGLVMVRLRVLVFQHFASQLYLLSPSPPFYCLSLSILSLYFSLSYTLLYSLSYTLTLSLSTVYFYFYFSSFGQNGEPLMMFMLAIWLISYPSTVQEQWLSIAAAPFEMRTFFNDAQSDSQHASFGNIYI